MAAKNEAKVQLLHPDPAKKGPNIAKTKYDLISKTIVQVLSADKSGEGVLWKELTDKVSACLTAEEIAGVGSVGWYTVSVKLHLEATGNIERTPGKSPQRLRLLKPL